MGQLSFTDFIDGEGSEHLDILTNEHIAAHADMRPDRVQDSTGSETRFILKKDSTPQDLAREVVKKFLQKTGLSRSDIGGIALVHTNHDLNVNQPQSIADAINEEINLTQKRIIAISYGCAGFPEIVSRAARLCHEIEDGKHVLVATVEAPDLMINPAERTTGPLFAADATATSLYKGNDGHQLLFAETRDVSPPNGYKGPGIFTFEESDVLDFQGRTNKRTIFHMDGEQAYENASLLMSDALFQSLDRVMADPQYHERAVFGVPHQANWKIMRLLDADARKSLEKVNKYLLTKFRVINAADTRCNTLSSTIPSALARFAAGNVLNRSPRNKHNEIYEPPKKGDVILIPAAGICMADPIGKMSQGFGAIEW